MDTLSIDDVHHLTLLISHTSSLFARDETLRTPNIAQGEILESHVTIGKNTCSDVGIYEFTMGATGAKVKGRYSFVYVWEDDEWKINHHHSSMMPEGTMAQVRVFRVCVFHQSRTCLTLIACLVTELISLIHTTYDTTWTHSQSKRKKSRIYSNSGTPPWQQETQTQSPNATVRTLSSSPPCPMFHVPATT